MNHLFCQQVKFNRVKGAHGDLYASVKKPIVDRAVVAVKSEQASSVMVQAGKPYLVFITGNESQPEFFATAGEAITFAKSVVANHPAIVR